MKLLLLFAFLPQVYAANPTCDPGFTCSAGTHLKNDLSAACATDTCDNDDCCDANPTCNNVNGQGSPFQPIGCNSLGMGYSLVSNMNKVCSGEICLPTDCCEPITCGENYLCASGTLNASATCNIQYNCQQSECCIPDPTCSQDNHVCPGGQTLQPDAVCPGGACTDLLCCVMPAPPIGGGGAPVCSLNADQTTCCAQSGCAWSNNDCIDDYALFGNTDQCTVKYQPADLAELKIQVDTCLAPDPSGVDCCFNSQGFVSIEPNCPSGQYKMNDIDTSQVTALTQLFKNKASFNADISGWDVSAVTHFEEVFRGADFFSQDLSCWDVDQGTTFDSMFYQAVSMAAQPPLCWDVQGAAYTGGFYHTLQSNFATCSQNYPCLNCPNLQQQQACMGANVCAWTNNGCFVGQADATCTPLTADYAACLANADCGYNMFGGTPNCIGATSVGGSVPCPTHNGDETACCSQAGCAWATGDDCIDETALLGNPNLCNAVPAPAPAASPAAAPAASPASSPAPASVPCPTHNGDETACCAQDGCAWATGDDCIDETQLYGNPNLCNAAPAPAPVTPPAASPASSPAPAASPAASPASSPAPATVPCPAHNGDENACCAQDGCAWASGDDCIDETQLYGNPNLCPAEGNTGIVLPPPTPSDAPAPAPAPAPITIIPETTPGVSITVPAPSPTLAAPNETSATTGACAGSPCQNGGICTNDGLGGFSCACDQWNSGWTGATCETDFAECGFFHRNDCPNEPLMHNGAQVPCSAGADCTSIDPNSKCYTQEGICRIYTYQCTELAGSYACECGPGFFGDGYTCRNVTAPCLENEYVSGNLCTPCPTGHVNMAGENPTGADTTCSPIACVGSVNGGELTNSTIGCVFGTATGTYGNCGCSCISAFSGFFCDECALGYGYTGGECVACVSPRASDTTLYSESCQDQVCGVDKRLVTNFNTSSLDEAVNCEDCPSGMESNATSLICTDIVCAENEYVSANTCTACPGIQLNPAGDVASGADTSCSCPPGTTLSGSRRLNAHASCSPGDLVINEFHGDGDPEDWIELKNVGPQCSIAGWKLYDQGIYDDMVGKADEIVTFSNVELASGGFYLGYKEITQGDFMFEFGIKKSGETIYLEAPDGTITQMQHSDTLPEKEAVGLCGASVTSLGDGTPGSDNDCPAQPAPATAPATAPAIAPTTASTGTCIPIICGTDHYVSNHVCTPCPAGFVNSAGDDASGANTTCVEPCDVDYYVAGNVCTECPEGFGWYGGDNPEGSDTPVSFPNPPGPDTICYNSTMCGNRQFGKVYCNEDTTVECADDMCVCVEGKTGETCSRNVMTLAEIQNLADAYSSDLLVSDAQINTLHDDLALHLEDIVTAESRKANAVVKDVVLANAVTLNNLNTQQKVLSDGKTAMLAAAPDLHASDTCVADPSTCASLDLSDVPENTVVFLETGMRNGAFSVLAKGGVLITRQRRYTPSTSFYMRCFDNDAGVWGDATLHSVGDLYACNGFAMLIGSQVAMCEATVGTDMGTCGAHGSCGVDGASWVCDCDDGWAGALCETPFTVPSHCHQFDCDSYGGHAGDISIPDGTAQSALVGLCCTHATRAAFDAVCDATADRETHFDLGCCHRENCI